MDDRTPAYNGGAVPPGGLDLRLRGEVVQERVSTQYLRRLGLFDGIMMTVGGIIGAGIFLNPSIVAARTGSSALTLGAWIIGGIIALTGALCFAELGSRFPKAGGGYVYLRDAFGPLPAFLYGWTLLLVINSGALAAVATIAAGYSLELAGVPDGRTLPLTLGFILLFTAVNYFGIRPGAAAQNLFTLLKLAALGLVIVVGGLLTATPPAPGPSAPTAPTGPAGAILALAIALIPVMFATGGWQNSNFIAAEVRDPRRILPRAILGGVVVVVTVYVLVNAAYLRALGVEGLAASSAPAAETVRAALGEGAGRLVSLGVVFSTLGILNLFILAAPRVYQAMADDGLFFRAASRLHPRYRTPSGALLFQAGWAGLLAASGTYGQLLDYVVFGDWIFFGSVAATLWIYRRRERSESTPEAGIFRTPAFHLVAGAFVAAAIGIVAASIYSNPGNALLGALLIASGVPVFRLWRARS